MYLNLYQKYTGRGLCEGSVTRPGETYRGRRVNERQQAATIIFVIFVHDISLCHRNKNKTKNVYSFKHNNILLVNLLANSFCH